MLNSTHQNFLSKYAIPEKHYSFDEAPIAAVRSPHVSNEILDRAIVHPDERIRYRASMHKNLTPAHLNILKDDPDADISADAYRHPNASAEMLEGGVDKSYTIRANIASNTNTPEHVLKMLVTDKNRNIRRFAIENPEMTPALLKIAAADPDYINAHAALHHEKADPDVFMAGLNHPDKFTRDSATILMSRHQQNRE